MGKGDFLRIGLVAIGGNGGFLGAGLTIGLSSCLGLVLNEQRGGNIGGGTLSSSLKAFLSAAMGAAGDAGGGGDEHNTPFLGE